MKKGMVFLTVVVFAVTLAMPALGAEAPKPGGQQQNVQLPRLVCYIEGAVDRVERRREVPNGSTIACPSDDHVNLLLSVKNAGGGVTQGNISVSGNIHKPQVYEVHTNPITGVPIPCGGTFQGPCPHAINYVDTPFSVQPAINLQPGNAVRVYSTQVQQHCSDPYLQTSDFPEEIRMSAQIGGLSVGAAPVSCMYQIKINKKAP